MARVTVEDCIGEEKTNNRFELVVLASRRTKDALSGSPITVPDEDDKLPVIALREIAAGNIKIGDLRDKFINSLHPQSALGTLDEEIDQVDKDVIDEEFASYDAEIGLTEEQMLLDSDESMSFEDIDLSEEEKF